MTQPFGTRWNVPGKRWAYFAGGNGWLSHVVEMLEDSAPLFFCERGRAAYGSDVHDIDDAASIPTCLWCAAWWMP